MGLEGRFEPNPNFESAFEELQRNAMRELGARLNMILEPFCVEYGGRDVEIVRPALAAAWASVNQGANLAEPSLTQCATVIAQGGRMWIDERGHVMLDDGE